MLHEARAKKRPQPWLHLSRQHGLSERAETIVHIITLGGAHT